MNIINLQKLIPAMKPGSHKKYGVLVPPKSGPLTRRRRDGTMYSTERWYPAADLVVPGSFQVKDPTDSCPKSYKNHYYTWKYAKLLFFWSLGLYLEIQGFKPKAEKELKAFFYSKIDEFPDKEERLRVQVAYQISGGNMWMCGPDWLPNDVISLRRYCKIFFIT